MTKEKLEVNISDECIDLEDAELEDYDPGLDNKQIDNPNTIKCRTYDVSIC